MFKIFDCSSTINNKKEYIYDVFSNGYYRSYHDIKILTIEEHGDIFLLIEELDKIYKEYTNKIGEFT